MKIEMGISIAEAQHNIKKALQQEANADYPEAASLWRESAKALESQIGQSDVSANCYINWILCIIKFNILTGSTSNNIASDITDFTRGLTPKLDKLDVKNNEFLALYYSKIEKLLKDNGFILLANHYRIKKKNKQKDYFKNEDSTEAKLKYSSLLISKFTSNYGESLTHLFIIVFLVLALFFILYGISGSVIYENCGIPLEFKNSGDLAYFTFAKFFGGSVHNLITISWIGKALTSLELFLGFLSLALLVNIFLKSWYSD